MRSSIAPSQIYPQNTKRPTLRDWNSKMSMQAQIAELKTAHVALGGLVRVAIMHAISPWLVKAHCNRYCTVYR
jgi:hypothetical protein